MWNFQRIICIWICCVSCMFGTTQLSSAVVQAVPYEYFDDHEQNLYDLDTEQIQAKYDARLLTQQMLQTEQQQQQHLENLKAYQANEYDRRASLQNKNYLSEPVSTTKLKSNVGFSLNNAADDDEYEQRDAWLEDTSTKPSTITSAITEPLDELHLPRAASCFTNGQKFTHGQKVPRLDSCEVCLCMDGEIFCWWEKCDKKPTKALTTFNDYSTPFEESSTTRMQLNPKTTYRTTLKPMKKPKTQADYYKYDDNDAADMQHEYEEGLQEQLKRKEYELKQHKMQQLNNKQQENKKKIFQHQHVELKEQELEQEKEREKHNKKKIKEQIKSKKNQEQQPNKYKTNEHHHGHNHNNNHYYGTSGSSSKILNFPENLPSVLYYDYKTEEHHQHQHQHHEQHLKHQKQKQQLLLQQHEKELKQQQQQQHQKHHVNRHHEYGQDFKTYEYNSQIDKTLTSSDGVGTGAGAPIGGVFATVEITEGSKSGYETNKLRNMADGRPSTLFKYFNNGNENIYDERMDSQTDSDILPEPPTKKPKFLTSIADTKTTGTPTLQFNGSPLLSSSTTTTVAAVAAGTGTTLKSTTSTGSLTNTATATPSIPLKKQIFSTWEYNEKYKDKTNNNSNNNNNNEGSEDTIESDDQDDAFHRWLTSTETNNKNNFTLNAAIIGRDDDGGLNAAAAGLDDYNVEDRNYENIDLETETGIFMKNTKTKPGAATTSYNKFQDAKEGGGEISSDNNSYNKNNNTTKSNVIINGSNKHNKILAYQNYNEMEWPTSTTSTSTLTSNEENGVANVVNIDIMLTASSTADLQQQQQQPQQANTETTNQHTQLQLHDFEHEKQIAKTQQNFIKPPILISNTNDVVHNNNSLYQIINKTNRNFNSSSNSNSNNNTTITNNIIAADGRIQLENVGDANMSSSITNLNNNQTLTSSQNLASDQVTTSQTNIAKAATTLTTSATLSTTLNPERQCNVMGTLYKIGDILPQDTGNCLQCICIDGSTSDDTPRVTCSPHNCPPLVLPDLFDATGY